PGDVRRVAPKRARGGKAVDVRDEPIPRRSVWCHGSPEGSNHWLQLEPSGYSVEIRRRDEVRAVERAAAARTRRAVRALRDASPRVQHENGQQQGNRRGRRGRKGNRAISFATSASSAVSILHCLTRRSSLSWFSMPA